MLQAMSTHPLTQGMLIENSSGIGPVSRGMVRSRAVELAVINGRPAGDVSKADWEQAKRELAGRPEMGAKEAALEAAPESARWDPVPGSTGQAAAETSDEEADDEGRNESAQLVAEGVGEAEHDQMLQAARAAIHLDRREA
jgi:hypothetical protein